MTRPRHKSANVARNSNYPAYGTRRQDINISHTKNQGYNRLQVTTTGRRRLITTTNSDNTRTILQTRHTRHDNHNRGFNNQHQRRHALNHTNRLELQQARSYVRNRPLIHPRPKDDPNPIRTTLRTLHIRQDSKHSQYGSLMIE